MISIIICSRTAELSHELYQNIDETIGCNYELIIIDNSINTYSIFEAYNLGIERSLGTFLCFIHDDVLFHTQNWGTILKTIFDSDNKIGLLGLAGSKVKTKMPSAWFNCDPSESVYNVIQHVPTGKKEEWFFGFVNPIEELVAIDGFFMVIKKECQVYFNATINGFHNYDLNISFEVQKKGYKIVGTNEILIEHFSLGNVNKDWVQSTFQIHKMYNKFLPLNLELNKNNKEHEIINAKLFINKSLNFGFKYIAFKVWCELFLLQPKSKYHFRFWINLLK